MSILAALVAAPWENVRTASPRRQAQGPLPVLREERQGEDAVLRQVRGGDEG